MEIVTQNMDTIAKAAGSRSTSTLRNNIYCRIVARVGILKAKLWYSSDINIVSSPDEKRSCHLAVSSGSHLGGAL